MANLIKQKQIGALTSAAITSGVFADARISQGSVTQWEGMLDIGGNQITSVLAASLIPNLDVSKLNAGILGGARGGLGVSSAGIQPGKMYAGPVSGENAQASFRVLAAADIPVLSTAKISGGTFADGLIAASNCTQHNAAIVTAATVKSALGNAMAGNALSLGNSSTVVTAPGNLAVSGTSTLTGSLTASGNVIIAGDLTVNGTTTSINTTSMELADHNIVFDSDNTTEAFAAGSGFTIVKSGDDLSFSCTTAGVMELKIGSNYSDLKVGALTLGTQLTAANVGNLPANKITSGEFADQRISQSSVTQYQGNLDIGGDQITSVLAANLIPNHSASKITSGAFGPAQLAANCVEKDAIRTDSIIARHIKMLTEKMDGAASPSANEHTFTIANRKSDQNDGIGDGSHCWVMLNGVMLLEASADNKVSGGTQDGDFFIRDAAVGNGKELIIDSDLLTDATDRIVVKYIPAKISY